MANVLTHKSVLYYHSIESKFCYQFTNEVREMDSAIRWIIRWYQCYSLCVSLSLYLSLPLHVSEMLDDFMLVISYRCCYLVDARSPC